MAVKSSNNIVKLHNGISHYPEECRVERKPAVIDGLPEEAVAGPQARHAA